jgi:hypothetical protein
MKFVVSFSACVSFLIRFANAQIQDDFSDGDFSAKPNWVGDTSSWTASSGVLKSKNTVASSQFYLSTGSEMAKNTEWTILTSLQFNTSSLNYVDIYLVADSADIKSAVKNGYFVRIGGTKDEICLYKRKNGTVTLLIDGADGVTNKSANTINVKVTCNDKYEWNLGL